MLLFDIMVQNKHRVNTKRKLISLVDALKEGSTENLHLVFGGVNDSYSIA